MKSYITFGVLSRSSFIEQMWYFGGCSAYVDGLMVIYCTVKWVGECG